MHCLELNINFCVIISVSQGKGSMVFCKLELHVLRQENLSQNLALSWVKLEIIF